MIIYVDVYPIFEIICQYDINLCSNVSYFLIILSPYKLTQNYKYLNTVLVF